MPHQKQEILLLMRQFLKKTVIFMTIYSVYSEEFKSYGKVLPDYDTAPLLQAMKQIPMPEGGVSYEAGIASLEALDIYGDFTDRAYGGMPIQIGLCWGYNTKLNCLEYHRDSELNIGTEDYILMLAKQDEITDGQLDTSKVKIFKAPAGAVVEVYATTLHYAPCHLDESIGFRVAVVLPKGTNTAAPVLQNPKGEDAWMTARNKWLLAHPDTSEAAQGAHIGLAGKNIDLSE